MAEQSAASHFHHPVPTYLVAFFTTIAMAAVLSKPGVGFHREEVTVLSLAAAIFVLGSISRTYTVKLQDRIIMLEMKVRCAELLPAGRDAALAKLSAKQIVALRFASDDELGALLDRAVRENLKPGEIKAAVKTWRPDLHRT